MGWAQFNCAIQGTISDPSSARIPKAAVRLQNTQTGVSQELQTNDAGYYRFLSLPPGDYSVTVSISGFQTKVLKLQVTTGQSRDLDFSMQVEQSATSIQVTGEAPILDTAESRQQITLNQSTMRDLPLQNNNFFSTLSLAPGVTGSNSASDNFNTEYNSGMSANGRSAAGNSFTVDGLNTNSNIYNGGSNVMLNPDAIQEVTIETNTFKAEQGVGSSLVVSIASKAGTNQFHGAGTYFFQNQDMQARTSLPFIAKYQPFMRHNLTGALGGPIIKNKTFFFSSVEMLRSKTGSTSTQTYESQEFLAWAKQNLPNTIGTNLLSTYPITGATQTSVLRNVQQVLGNSNCGPASATGIPCDMPMLVQGTWTRSPFRNGLAYNFRVDEYLSTADRLYGSYVYSESERETLEVREAFSYSTLYHTKAAQANWTHTFNPTTINQFTFGGTSIYGGEMTAGLFQIPSMSITNSASVGQGTANTYAQKNFNWRDVVTWVKGTHTLNFGGTFFWGSDVNLNPFGNRPSFSYNNLLDFVQDKIYSGRYGTYDPLTGKPKIFDMGAKMTTEGLFVQDEWKVRPNLNLTLSIRWDDFGNPVGVKGMSNVNQQFQMTNVFVAPGKTVDEQFANASVKLTSAQYAHRLTNNFSPRVGFAWSPTGGNKTSIRGGIGLYYDWVTLGDSVDRVNFNPPNYLVQNFGQTLALKPPSAPLLGTGGDYKNFFGFNLPTLPSITLDSRGGLAGLSSNIGGLDPNLRAPTTLNYMIGVERELPSRTVVGATYSGSYIWDGLTGTDYNRFPGDLLTDNILNRLNPSFGTITYIKNADVVHYNAMILRATKNLGSAGMVQASYTLSHTTDFYNGGHRSVNFDTNVDPRLLLAFPADASWDNRHRLSALGVYRLPTPFSENFLAKRVLGGWELSSTLILETGTPFTFYNGNNRAQGGDYNADGYNYDFPNVPSDLVTMYDRSHFLGANAGAPAYIASQFTAPTLGTQGDAPRNGFRDQGRVLMNSSLIKNNKLPSLGENCNFQLKFESFNVLNRVNLGGVNSNLGNVNFGKIQSQGATRVVQVGARLSF